VIGEYVIALVYGIRGFPDTKHDSYRLVTDTKSGVLVSILSEPVKGSKAAAPLTTPRLPTYT